MDRDGLAAFLAVHRERSFSRAAERLYRTQPAISRRVRLLEQALGAPLFERTAQGPVLSQAGRVLLPHAERALAALADAEAAVRALAGPDAGPISLAVVGTLADAAFGDVLRAFARRHPAVEMRLRTATSAEVSDLVRRGEALLGLRYGSDSAADLDCVTLSRERLIVVCAPDHPLAGRTVAGLRDLAQAHWLAFPDQPGRSEHAAAHIFAMFLAHGIEAPDWTAVDSLTAQKRLVEAGFGLALLAESGVAEECGSGRLAAITVAGLDASRPVVLVRRGAGFLSMAAQDFCRHLATHLAWPETAAGR
ncbi:LysR family transcriptional regulator [Marinibaculum pumilum]|uniref:LysR family transcriptional regulator n=1 Tax=Marinibaculum pumilum TaxID=1766165 RepID=A0ABV7L1R0_9PROT